MKTNRVLLIILAMMGLAIIASSTLSASNDNVMRVPAAQEGYYLKQMIQNHFVINPDKVELVKLRDGGGEYAVIMVKGVSNKKLRGIIKWMVELPNDYWLKKYIRGYSYYYGNLLIIMKH